MRQTDGVESVVVTLTSALWGRIWASSHRLTFSDKALGAASMAASGSTPRHHLCPCIRSSHASPIFSVPFFAAKEGRKQARLRSFVRSPRRKLIRSGDFSPRRNFSSARWGARVRPRFSHSRSHLVRLMAMSLQNPASAICHSAAR